jgi:hypothetical protein
MNNMKFGAFGGAEMNLHDHQRLKFSLPLHKLRSEEEDFDAQERDNFIEIMPVSEEVQDFHKIKMEQEDIIQREMA